MQHAYESMNTALGTAWAAIAPGSGFTIYDKNSGQPGPTEGLRVIWESEGLPTGTPGQLLAQLDLAILVPPVGTVVVPGNALVLQTALDRALGFLGTFDGHGGTGTGRLGRMDFTTDPPTFLCSMDVIPVGGWEAIASGSPGLVCRARTILLRFWTNLEAPVPLG